MVDDPQTEPDATRRVLAGREIRYVRTASATGAFAWNIGAESLTTPGTWVKRMWTGTAWITTGKGTLA